MDLLLRNRRCEGHVLVACVIPPTLNPGPQERPGPPACCCTCHPARGGADREERTAVCDGLPGPWWDVQGLVLSVPSSPC